MFKLDYFSHRFMDRRLVFLMDLVISLASSMFLTWRIDSLPSYGA